jgi:Protein of unknwon function (DUF3310)
MPQKSGDATDGYHHPNTAMTIFSKRTVKEKCTMTKQEAVNKMFSKNKNLTAKVIAEKFDVTVGYGSMLLSKARKARIAQNDEVEEQAEEMLNGLVSVVDVPQITHYAALDTVNAPPHYTVGGIEVIDFIEAKNLNYRLGNVIKYISRAAHKGDYVENLRKARWYLDREIAKQEGLASIE